MPVSFSGQQSQATPTSVQATNTTQQVQGEAQTSPRDEGSMKNSGWH